MTPYPGIVEDSLVNHSVPDMIFQFKSSARFKREIESWVDEKIISREQADKLFRKYQLLKEPPWYFRSGFILKGVALLLAGMGMLLLISENWHRFNIPVRMSFGLVPLLAAYGIGFRFLSRGKEEQAELTFFFAGIAFGVNIFLQAQIFHISAYYPNGILWWIIGTLPIALYFRSSLHHALVQLLYLVWLTQQLSYHHFSGWAPFLFAGMIYLLYRKPNKVLLLAGIVNAYLLIFSINQWIDRNHPEEIFLLFSVTTLLIILLLPYFQHQYHEIFIHWIRRLGITAIFLVFYLHTYPDLVENYMVRNSMEASISLFAFLIFLAVLGLLLRSRGYPLLDIAFLLTGIILAIHALGILYPMDKESFGVVGAITTNIVILGCALWSIYYGIRQHLKRYFMSGIFIILLVAISRYTDLAGDYLLASFIFILSGILLYFVNNYWNKRYELQ